MPGENEIVKDKDQFGKLITDDGGVTGYFDQTDVWFNKKLQKIEFHHLPSNKSVSFKSFLTNFSDSYESEWNSETVYGRNDPIMTFQGTRRSVSIGWQVVAGSSEEARQNLFNCQNLLSMLYPVYIAGSIQAPPIFRLKVMNLVQDAKNPGTGSAAVTGLVGTASGFSVNPDLDVGFFDDQVGKVYPKVINLECTYTALHTHELGYDDTGAKIGDFGRFPYGLGSKGRTQPPAGANVKNTNASEVLRKEETQAEARESLANDCQITSGLDGCISFENTSSEG